MDKDGDGCVDLAEFMHWYESNHSGGEASAIEEGGDGNKRHSKRLLAKLESWSDQLLALVNEDGASPVSLLLPPCIVSLTRARVRKLRCSFLEERRSFAGVPLKRLRAKK